MPLKVGMVLDLQAPALEHTDSRVQAADGLALEGGTGRGELDAIAGLQGAGPGALTHAQIRPATKPSSRSAPSST